MRKAESKHLTTWAMLWALNTLLGLSLTLTATFAFAGAAPGITVVGNQLLTTTAGTLGVQSVGANVPVVLRGINLSGSEYACDSQNSFFDDPPGNQNTINGMLAWHANVIRLPLNEDCWIGTKAGLNPTYSGVNYQNAIKTFVNLANASGFIVEVDSHPSPMSVLKLMNIIGRPVSSRIVRRCWRDAASLPRPAGEERAEARHLREAIQLVEAAEDRMVLRHLDDLAIGEQQLHLLLEVGPLGRAVEIVDHREAAAQRRTPAGSAARFAAAACCSARRSRSTGTRTAA